MRKRLNETIIALGLKKPQKTKCKTGLPWLVSSVFKLVWYSFFHNFAKCSLSLAHLPSCIHLSLQQRLCSRRMVVGIGWKCSCSSDTGGMEPLLAAAGGGLPSSDQCEHLHPVLASLSSRNWTTAKAFPFKTLWSTLQRLQVKNMYCHTLGYSDVDFIIWIMC